MSKNLGPGTRRVHRVRLRYLNLPEEEALLKKGNYVNWVNPTIVSEAAMKNRQNARPFPVIGEGDPVRVSFGLRQVQGLQAERLQGKPCVAILSLGEDCKTKSWYKRILADFSRAFQGGKRPGVRPLILSEGRDTREYVSSITEGSVLKVMPTDAYEFRSRSGSRRRVLEILLPRGPRVFACLEKSKAEQSLHFFLDGRLGTSTNLDKDPRMYVEEIFKGDHLAKLYDDDSCFSDAIITSTDDPCLQGILRQTLDTLRIGTTDSALCSSTTIPYARTFFANLGRLYDDDGVTDEMYKRKILKAHARGFFISLVTMGFSQGLSYKHQWRSRDSETHLGDASAYTLIVDLDDFLQDLELEAYEELIKVLPEFKFNITLVAHPPNARATGSKAHSFMTKDGYVLQGALMYIPDLDGLDRHGPSKLTKGARDALVKVLTGENELAMAMPASSPEAMNTQIMLLKDAGALPRIIPSALPRNDTEAYHLQERLTTRDLRVVMEHMWERQEINDEYGFKHHWERAVVRNQHSTKTIKERVENYFAKQEQRVENAAAIPAEIPERPRREAGREQPPHRGNAQDQPMNIDQPEQRRGGQEARRQVRGNERDKPRVQQPRKQQRKVVDARRPRQAKDRSRSREADQEEELQDKAEQPQEEEDASLDATMQDVPNLREIRRLRNRELKIQEGVQLIKNMEYEKFGQWVKANPELCNICQDRFCEMYPAGTGEVADTKIDPMDEEEMKQPSISLEPDLMDESSNESMHIIESWKLDTNQWKLPSTEDRREIIKGYKKGEDIIGVQYVSVYEDGAAFPTIHPTKYGLRASDSMGIANPAMWDRNKLSLAMDIDPEKEHLVDLDVTEKFKHYQDAETGDDFMYIQELLYREDVAYPPFVGLLEEVEQTMKEATAAEVPENLERRVVKLVLRTLKNYAFMSRTEQADWELTQLAPPLTLMHHVELKVTVGENGQKSLQMFFVFVTEQMLRNYEDYFGEDPYLSLGRVLRLDMTRWFGQGEIHIWVSELEAEDYTLLLTALPRKKDRTWHFNKMTAKTMKALACIPFTLAQFMTLEEKVEWKKSARDLEKLRKMDEILRNHQDASGSTMAKLFMARSKATNHLLPHIEVINDVRITSVTHANVPGAPDTFRYFGRDERTGITREIYVEPKQPLPLDLIDFHLRYTKCGGDPQDNFEVLFLLDAMAEVSSAVQILRFDKYRHYMNSNGQAPIPEINFFGLLETFQLRYDARKKQAEEEQREEMEEEEPPIEEAPETEEMDVDEESGGGLLPGPEQHLYPKEMTSIEKLMNMSPSQRRAAYGFTVKETEAMYFTRVSEFMRLSLNYNLDKHECYGNFIDEYVQELEAFFKGDAELPWKDLCRLNATLKPSISFLISMAMKLPHRENVIEALGRLTGFPMLAFVQTQLKEAVGPVLGLGLLDDDDL